MNATECDALVADVTWADPTSLLILSILLLITLMVIIGNCLVIAAVYISSKLRTVTNLFIVSLAVADLLVGLAVLPFSAAWEVFKVWIFGDIWCSVWLAVDVWMCTASILNLCAISLDRYVAVTRPVNYPSIMSSSRAKYLIAGVWILSFVICFPPLVGWKDANVVRDSEPVTVPTFSTVGQTTVRIMGSHTIITEAANATDLYPHIISYQTNFSQHIVDTTKKTPFNFEEDSKNLKAQIYKYNENMIPAEEKAEKTELYLKRGGLVKRALAAFSGVPVLSSDMFDTLTPSTEGAQIAESSDSGPTSPPFHHCPWICELTNDTGYVIYSALGSFFIPMTVMLFFYWRIYRAAMLTTRAINQGFRTTKGTGGFGNRFDEQRLTLRIHRGRGSVQNHNHGHGHGSTHSSHTNLTTNGGHSSLSASPSTTSTGKSPELQRLTRAGSRNRHEPVTISVSYPSTDQINSPAAPGQRTADKTYLTPNARRSSLNAPKKTTFSVSPPRRSFIDLSPKKSQSKSEVMYSVHYTNKNGRDVTESALCRSRDPNCYLRVSGSRAAGGRRSLSIDSTTSNFDEESAACSRRNSTRSQNAEEGGQQKDLSPSPTYDDHPQKQSSKAVPKMGKRNIKAQVKRFRMETKAAKTLAIIVGGFIVCWMPFFTIYLIRAFCEDCINPIVFSVLFWLGYCNSAINPCIYALFSKDFRFAFKKIICRCLCGRQQPLNLGVKRRGSDASNLKTPTHGRRRSMSQHPPCMLGDDSDPGGSDSR